MQFKTYIMKKTRRIFQAIVFTAFIVLVTGLLTSYRTIRQDENKNGPNGCVIISTWKDCSSICTGAKCYQFKNNCTYKVKVTFRSKNTNETWTSYELYLKAGEESQEGMLCPYIEMKWEYEKA